MSTPADVPSIRIVKEFPYRGGQQQWSNRYYFVGNPAPTDSEFLGLYDALRANEELVASARTTILHGIGYHAGSDVPVWQGGASFPGTMAPAPNPAAPGDCAAVVRWTTDQRSIKNHPIYLFNYYHDVYVTEGADADTLVNMQHTRLQSYAQDWAAGIVVGANTLKRCGPRGAVGLVGTCNPLVTHRDFPR